MNIEVGMYVRTTYFGITKIEKIIEDDFDTIWYLVKIKGLDGLYHEHRLTKNQIVKLSFNIIDLIEVGDYVNGEYMLEHYLQHNRIEHTYNSYWYEQDIKEILTHEQYKANVYEVGSDIK